MHGLLVIDMFETNTKHQVQEAKTRWDAAEETQFKNSKLCHPIYPLKCELVEADRIIGSSVSTSTDRYM